MEVEAFKLASVVLPASDGTLSELGFSVRDLGFKALGCVKEARGKKCHVIFPELKMAMWVSQDELADVHQRSSQGDKSYGAVVERLKAENPLLYWVNRASHFFPMSHLLELEAGPLEEIWDPSNGDIRKYWSGGLHSPVGHIGIGIEELFLADWKRFESEIGSELLFARFLPAGLAKMELSLYLKSDLLL